MANDNKTKETKDEITKEVKTEVKTTDVKSEEVVAEPNDKVVEDTKVEDTKVEETKVEETKKPVKKGDTIKVIAVFGRVDLKTTMVDTVTPVDVEDTDEVKAALKWNIIKVVE